MIKEKPEVVLLGAVRTPIGKYGGTLKNIPATELGATVVRESVKSAGISAEDVEQVVLGNVIHCQPQDMYLSRVAAIQGGIPVSAPALTVNRLCGSGLQAIVSAAQLLWLGYANVAVAGGAESMSRAPYWLHELRWGKRMNNAVAQDVMVAALTDPFDEVHMGVTAERVARKWGVSRQDQDELACESHKRAVAALQEGRFQGQIVPVEIKEKGSCHPFTQDESPRRDVTLEKLAMLQPIFDEGGTVTVGNASSINDGAAAVVLMEQNEAKNRGLAPIGRLVDYAVAGVEPSYMGIGPVPAVRKVLNRTGLTIEDIDMFEVNEAFAAQALAVMRDLNLPADKTNPNGSGISLGHPIGATGAILVVKILHELRRVGGRYGLVTMCIGGGQGIAAIFESLP